MLDSLVNESCEQFEVSRAFACEIGSNFKNEMSAAFQWEQHGFVNFKITILEFKIVKILKIVLICFLN